jgi:hypothetical protein
MGAARRPTPPWGAVEWFVLVQYLSAALLFLPGAQSARLGVRALPYVASLALLVYSLSVRGPGVGRLPGQFWLVLAGVVMGLNLLHPGTNTVAGLAQIVFQVSIAAPLFWVERFAMPPARVGRLLGLIFLANAAGAVVGLMQVFDPDRFMPPEFSRQALSTNPLWVESLTYLGPDGRKIIRPCGLSDLPGGAASAGATTALLGALLAVRPGGGLVSRFACVALAGLGALCVYLTQVRSLLLMTAVTYALMCVLLVRQRRFAQGTALAGLGAGVLVAAFLGAVTVGGGAVFERFAGLFETGLVEHYRRNRGGFVEHTFTTLLSDYPLGAGLGRWGMMESYFSPYDAPAHEPIHAEIQVTGWLLDGGVPLVLLYAAALAAAVGGLYRLTGPAAGGRLAYAAAVVLGANCFILGQSWAGPAFNTTLGIQFWLLSAVVLVAARQSSVVGRQSSVKRVRTADQQLPTDDRRPTSDDR